MVSLIVQTDYILNQNKILLHRVLYCVLHKYVFKNTEQERSRNYNKSYAIILFIKSIII